jgi:hypothetical protein
MRCTHALMENAFMRDTLHHGQIPNVTANVSQQCY